MKQFFFKKRARGFTLIELLVVMGIIAILVGLSTVNYLNARQRARDGKQKSELLQVKTALRLYYNDYQNYPDNTAGFLISGCGADGDLECPCSTTIDFAAGGAECDTIYMKQLPVDFGSAIEYSQETGGDDFCLTVDLENTGDGDIALSQARCASVCDTFCTGNEYCVCAD